MRGRVFKYGDNISTDHIIQGRYMHLRSNIKELSKHTLEDLDPEFVKKVKDGDFVAGGKNFGIGSSREHAVLVLKEVGVKAVLAKSFARIFFRNAINQGLLPIICDTDLISDGDELYIDLTRGVVKNISKGGEVRIDPIPSFVLDILKDGGLVPYIRKHGDFEV